MPAQKRYILTDSPGLNSTEDNGKKHGPRRPLLLHNDSSEDEKSGGDIYPVEHLLRQHRLGHIGDRLEALR